MTLSLSSEFRVGDQVRHIHSGWAGPVVEVGDLITVRPMHPKPKTQYEVEVDAFVPVGDDWGGWNPIAVYPEELEHV